jgi:hypothetical protein
MVGLYGVSPATEDYGYTASAAYVGELAITEGAAITLGQPVEGEVALPGERVRYPLTLEADASLNITLSAAPDSPFDAYLSVYNADGVLLSANDEASYEDEGLDAGVTGLQLPAGNYTVEVGAFYDRTVGGYSLLVESAE